MSPKPITENTLFYGDNLPILREYIPTESVDLVYLDPPFNSNRSYSVLFRESGGASSEAQIEAFEDTWQWEPTAQGAYEEVMTGPHQKVGRMLQAMVDELKPGMTKNQVQFLLGTPLLSDPFHADRWDYVYRFKPAYKPAEQRHISLFFKGDLLSRVEGSVNPQP
jgi:adenine specific DNA methylase Mod